VFIKLGALRCFQPELDVFNKLLIYSLSPSKKEQPTLEEDERDKVQFMEL